MSGLNKILMLTVCMVLTSMPVSGQNFLDNIERERNLFVTHADIDPVTGDVLIISNSFQNTWYSLRRFHPDGEAVSDFVLQRFETCCAIYPVLVAVANDGSIYTVEYTGQLGGFFIYKHAPSGELDIDWGAREGIVEEIDTGEPSDYAGGVLDEDDENETGSGYETGETTLRGNAGGGRFHHYFTDPVDIIPREDGSLLVLDRAEKYIDLISPDGSRITEFIGSQGYIPERPQRLLMDSGGYLYLVDYYDDFDLNRSRMTGVFRFDPEGNWEFGWGEQSGGINDPWRPQVDIMTLVIDGDDNLIVLGSGMSNINHDEVYVFDNESGGEIIRGRVDFRQGYDSEFLGMVGNPESGFLVLDGFSFEIKLNFYALDGSLEEQVRIDDLYYLS